MSEPIEVAMHPENIEDFMKELDPQPEPNQFEVRGYELARLQPDGSWESVMKYTDSGWALKAANADFKWFSRRHPGKTYEVRALVSCALPKTPELGNAPLVLDADEPADLEANNSTPSYEESHPEVNA